MKLGGRKCVRALAALGLGLLMAGCGAVSAISPSTYMDNMSVQNANLSTATIGNYTGDYTLVLPPGVYAMNRHFKVQVGVTAGPVLAITIVEPSSLATNTDFLALIGRIESTNSLNVDGVSGATYSTRALLKAVDVAVPH